MPFDVEPVQAADRPAHERWRFTESEQRCFVDACEQGRCYIPHFATCPTTQRRPPWDPELLARWQANGGEA